MRVRATVLQTPVPGTLEVLEDHVLTVVDGTIESVLPAAQAGDEPCDVTLGADSVLLPGLIDTHVHAPQWPQRATGLDLPLERWLFEYTFPLEARYGDERFAAGVYGSLVRGLLSRGTTTAVYYSSIHEPATVALASACVEHGQRAFVGRVAMDHPEGTPDYYRDDGAARGVAASHRSIEAIRALGAGALVQPIVTPRFIPACTDALLEGLGELAAATGVRIQTHCSEGDWEHAYVLERHGCTDAQSLANFGLMADHTVLGHATHLTDPDRALIAGAGAGLSHCPLSNSYFANGVFPARRNLDAGLRIGLGSDLAGGAEASLLRQCAHAVTVSRLLESGVDTEIAAARRGVAGARIDITTAFWFATAGGADLVGVDAGLLEPGRVFDAFSVDVGASSAIGVVDELDDWDRIFEKIVRAGGGDVSRVWVDGREVAGSSRR